MESRNSEDCNCHLQISSLEWVRSDEGGNQRQLTSLAGRWKLYCHHVVKLQSSKTSYLHRQDSIGVLQTVRNLCDLLEKYSMQIASWLEQSNVRWNPILLLISVYGQFFGGVFGGSGSWLEFQFKTLLHKIFSRKVSRVQKRIKKVLF